MLRSPLLLGSALLLAIPALSQGTVNFSNRVPTAGVDAPLRYMDGSGVGSEFVAQLWAGPDANSLAPVGSPVPFINNPTTGAGTGYFVGGSRQIDSIPAGGPAVVQVRAWEATAGADWGTALASGGMTGQWPLLNLAATGNPLAAPPGLPVNLVGLSPMVVFVIPEPSVVALAIVAALGALWRVFGCRPDARRRA